MTPGELAYQIANVGLRVAMVGFFLLLGWQVAGTTGPVQWLEGGGRVKRGAAIALRALGAFVSLWVVTNMGGGGGDPDADYTW